MKTGIFTQNKRQALRFIESQPSTQTQVTFTPKENYLASRFFVEINYRLEGSSLSAFQAILTALGLSATSRSEMQLANGMSNAVAILSNSAFRSTFTDEIVVNVLLKGSAPLKNRVTATDCLLRDTIYSCVPPLIEWNINGVVGQIRIGFFVHNERPFMNESAMLFSVENQNSVRISLPNLVTGSGNNTVNLYAARSVVEQKYLYFESGGTVQATAPNGTLSIDERDIDEVFIYDNPAIIETTLFQTYLNGREVDSAFPNVMRYNSMLDAGRYPASSAQYATTPTVVAANPVDLKFYKIFTHPVLNLPPTSNKNRNFRAQFGLSSNTNIRFFFSKILETDAARLETENYVQAQQAVYSR